MRVLIFPSTVTRGRNILLFSALIGHGYYGKNMTRIAIKVEGKIFFKIENVGRLYCYVSTISSRNWAYKSLFLVAMAVIKTTVMVN
ncbi:MAG: hypothetical protein ACE5GV_10610 [Candidatus Scalindua sp.]